MKCPLKVLPFMKGLHFFECISALVKKNEVHFDFSDGAFKKVKKSSVERWTLLSGLHIGYVEEETGTD